MLSYPQVTHLVAGNTAGATALISTGSYQLAGGNNITLSQNGNSVTISGPNAGGAQTGISGIQVSDTTYTSGTVTFQNANGISFGSSGANGISASHNALTSQSNQAFSAAGGSSAFQTLGFSDNGFASFTNSNGSVAVTEIRASLFAVSNTTQSSSGTQNLDAISFAGAGGVSVGVSNGSVVISGGAGGAGDGGVFAGVSTGGNTAGSTGTVSTGNFVLVGSNGITLSQSTGAAGSAATITILGPPNTLSTFAPFPGPGLSTAFQTIATATSDQIRVYPFIVPEYVSAGILDIYGTMGFTTVGTSSGRQTGGIAVGIYSRNGGTLSSVASASFSWGVTGQNSSYTFNHPTSTDYTGYVTQTTNSSGVNISSGYTGGKLIGFPINTLLTPGQYYFAWIGTMSTSSINVGMTMQLGAAVMATQMTALAPMGSFSSGFSTGSNPVGGRFNKVMGLWTSAGSGTNLPASMAVASISAGLTQAALFNIWRT